VISNALLTVLEARYLAPLLDGLELRQTLLACFGMLVGAALLAEVAYGTWWVLDHVFGTGFIGQVISVGGGLTLGGAVYMAFVLWLPIPEARQVTDLFARRLRRRS